AAPGWTEGDGDLPVGVRPSGRSARHRAPLHARVRQSLERCGAVHAERPDDQRTAAGRRHGPRPRARARFRRRAAVARVVVDVAIAGAGPAGASLAIALARAGARVTLVEKDAAPRLKARGDGCLPHGVRALAEVVGGLPDGARVRGLRFVAGGMSVVADFPEGFGLVVRRDRLHAWLRERAAATPGVDLRLATRYAPCGESFTVGADGLRSQFHR